MPTSRTALSYERLSDRLLDDLAADPQRAAILLDIDGTLAPIVERPTDARVPPEARAEVRRLAARFALVACVTGRTGVDAKALVGVEEAVYVGVHGLEADPEAKAWAQRLREFADGVDWPVEDKGVTVSFHFREPKHGESALEYLQEVAERARMVGLVPRFGRKVLEVRPPVAADKGTAVLGLLAERGLARALYAGDDTTDLDAFRALDSLELAVRVAVVSDEAPPELASRADVVVAGTEELLGILRKL
jgi:trehalose 6-phosphate phosphatase